MIVGEFLVFREALMLKTGGGWRVQLKSSCFPSFWFSGKGFRGCGKEFDGSGKSGLWKKSVGVRKCHKLKVAVSRCFGKFGNAFSHRLTQFAMKGSVSNVLWLFKVLQFLGS
jgi:hypothetical protein